MDKLCVKHNILPSIIKDSRLDKQTFEKCYKNFNVFKEKIKKFDVNRFYKSETSEKTWVMSYLIIGSSSGLGRELAYTFGKV